MDTTYYLHLRFTGASLKCDENNFFELKEQMDIMHPIGRTQLSGMLHALFGYIPKPKNRLTMIESVPEIDALVDTTYIKYNNSLTMEHPNTFNEIFITGKRHYNSHLKMSNVINGKTFKMFFSWEYFRRIYIGNETEFKSIMQFLNNITKEDVVNTYTMIQFVRTFRKNYVSNYDVQKFIKEHYAKKNVNDNPYFRSLFGITDLENGGNFYASKNPLLNTSGIGKNISYDGELIVTFKNSELVKRLETYGRIPTLLDGGVIKVLSLEKYPPYMDLENDFVFFPKWKPTYSVDTK